MSVPAGLLPLLRPDPGTAQDWLRAELARREYQPTIWERIQGWLDDLLDSLGDVGSGLGGLGWPILVLVVLALVAAAALVLARLQRSPVGTSQATTVFGDVRRAAVDHRRLADAAHAAQDWDTAVLEAVRWLAADLAERGVTPDDPGITTREVTARAAPRFPDQARGLDDAVRSFEEVRYGGRTADRTRADLVLGVVREVTATPPGAAASTGPVLAVPR